MKRFLLATIFLQFFTFSCKTRTKIFAKFIIVNKSGLAVDSLLVMPGDKNYSKIKNNDSITYYSNMTNIAKVDGSYLLKFKKSDQQKIYNFGYYSNGYPQEDYIRIVLLSDTVNYYFKYKTIY